MEADGCTGSDIIREGWLHKRGEHIKTWRPRYFILKKDGYFYGYNSKPMPIEIDSPNNQFYVKDCKILTSDKPKVNVFIVRCLSNENITIERVFATSSSAEREDWIKAIQQISNELNGNIVIDKSENKHQKITLHDFEFLKVLGKGTFGKVILCRERSSKRLCAMKILKKKEVLEKNEVTHTETENTVMRTLKHPFITSLIYSFQTTDRLCLVMDYVNGGELFFHLSREKRFSEHRARFYCAEISYAIGFLHENNILYRDIKPENILLDCEGHIKLADFGLCKMNMYCESKTKTFCGTLEYLAPEIAMHNYNYWEGYTRAVDWWAVGVVLFEMLTGRLPFSAKQTDLSQDQQPLLNKIIHEEAKLPSDLSEDARKIISCFLDKNPAKRLGASAHDFNEVKQHPFFKLVNWQLLGEKKLEPPFKPMVDSETDTRYFEKDFTGENVQLTPTNSSALIDSYNHFDSFSFYGSRSSVFSEQSAKSHEGHSSSSISSSNDKFDTRSLLFEASAKPTLAPAACRAGAGGHESSSPTILKRSKLHHSSMCSDSGSLRMVGQPGAAAAVAGHQGLVNSSALFMGSAAFPNVIQFTDDFGQLFESRTFFASSNINLANAFAHTLSYQLPILDFGASNKSCDNIFMQSYFGSSGECKMDEQ